MMGPVGSSGKNGCSPLVSGIACAAAAEAYCLRSAIGAILHVFWAFKYAGRTRFAVRRSEAIVRKNAMGYQVFEIAPRARMRGWGNTPSFRNALKLLQIGRDKGELQIDVRIEIEVCQTLFCEGQAST